MKRGFRDRPFKESDFVASFEVALDRGQKGAEHTGRHVAAKRHYRAAAAPPSASTVATVPVTRDYFSRLPSIRPASFALASSVARKIVSSSIRLACSTLGSLLHAWTAAVTRPRTRNVIRIPCIEKRTCNLDRRILFGDPKIGSHVAHTGDKT